MRVAVAGAGMISQKHLTAWSRVPDAAVVAIVDPDESRAAARAREFGVPAHYPSLDALFAAQPVDAIDICSSRESHGALVRAAAARGIPAICEKPLVPSVAEAQALVDEVRGRARVMVNQNFRFRDYYRQIHAWIADGTLGELTGCTIACRSSGLLPNAEGKYPYIERQPFVRHEKRLMIEEVLIHRIDIARWLCGPLRVVAAATRHSCPALAGESEASVLFATQAAGMPVVVDGNFGSVGCPEISQDRVEVIGTRARATLEGSVLRLHGDTPREISYDLAAASQQSFDASMAHFVASLRSGTAFLIEAQDNVDTLRLVDDAYRAAAL
jgi:predicted dehydrogenase